ncbi:MAG: ligand-binding sensor domain-containing protein, partial [Mariniphaga sp.]
MRWFPFKNIRTDAGLLHPRVTAIETDSRGFIWVGTQNGLNLYDGYEFKSFTHDENDTTSLSDNDISYIYNDNADNIWIGTGTGMINRYCRKTNSFIRYDLPEKPGKRKDIKKIATDGHDNLWIGYTGGLVKFNPLTGEA